MIAISEKRGEMYKKDSMLDPLSGAYSRRFFEEWIKKESISNSKENFHYTMVLLDVDRFKQINDSCGHLSGDEAIKIVGSALFSCVRTTDYVIRYGGDEFMLLLNECSESQAEDIMYRVCDKLRKIDTVPFEISISYGIQEIKSRNDILKAMNQADKKMYEAKKTKNIS
jgi:diguanylate cyclase (GGDEF)-like protein